MVATASPVPPISTGTPQPSGKKAKKEGGKKLVTGYILYSSERRKTVSSSHPEATFGEISRIVGNEWRNLADEEKSSWEKRATKMNEENAARFVAENGEASCHSPAPTKTDGPIVQDIVLNHVSGLRRNLFSPDVSFSVSIRRRFVFYVARFID